MQKLEQKNTKKTKKNWETNDHPCTFCVPVQRRSLCNLIRGRGLLIQFLIDWNIRYQECNIILENITYLTISKNITWYLLPHNTTEKIDQQLFNYPGLQMAQIHALPATFFHELPEILGDLLENGNKKVNKRKKPKWNIILPYNFNAPKK